MNNNMIEMIDPKVFGDGNRTFTRWQDTGDLKRRIVEMGEQRDLALFAAGEWDKTLTLNPTANFIVEVFTDWLMDEIRFPELVAGWWWQEREVKGLCT